MALRTAGGVGHVLSALMQRAAAAEDARRAATILPPSLSCHLALSPCASSLRPAAPDGSFEIEVHESEPANDPSLAAFVAVDARMARTGGGESLREQNGTVFGHGRQTLDEFDADPELARRELRDALETAGYRLAIERR